jgi:hypothetical protein
MRSYHARPLRWVQSSALTDAARQNPAGRLPLLRLPRGSAPTFDPFRCPNVDLVTNREDAHRTAPKRRDELTMDERVTATCVAEMYAVAGIASLVRTTAQICRWMDRIKRRVGVAGAQP